MLALLAMTARAVGSTSSDYRATTDIIDSGGGRSATADYTNDSSIGGEFDLSAASAPEQSFRQGYIGQLYEAQAIELVATPASVTEGLTTQLTGMATMDDDTLVRLLGGDPVWSVVNGPITGIALNGNATAGEVFINAPATVRGSWDGIEGDLVLTVLNANLLPPGNEVPDPGFTVQGFAVNQVGFYQGILRDAGGNVVGALTGFRLVSSRAFSGKVVFNGSTYSLKGIFQPDGSYTGQILRSKKTPLDVTLQLGVTAAGGLTVQGTVRGDGTTGEGFIAQAPYTKFNPVPADLVKRYTFLVPAPVTGDAALPGGDGYGWATVSALGVIKAAGKTGDGVAFTTSGYLTKDGQWHLFQLLYASKGQMAGVLTFRDVPGISQVDGALRWVKNPNPVNKSYPLGFALDPGLVGSVYTPPLKGARALVELADQHYNARLTLAGTVLPEGGLARTISWRATNVLTYYGPEKLSARVTSTTGILAGSYYDPATKQKVPFAGAVLQSQGLAGGNFLVGNQSGYLLVEPGTSFPYPGSESAGELAGMDLPGSPAAAPILSPVVFSTLVAGSFGGILENGPDISGGMERVVISKTGAISGTVVIEGLRLKFKGLMGADGLAHVEIPRKGLSSILGNLSLGLADGTVEGFQLTGEFNVDGKLHAIDAQRFGYFPRASPSLLAGRYTVAMPSLDLADVTLEPGGASYGSLTVATTGTITGALKLTDGSSATFSGRVSRSGEWSLHRSLYGTTGGYLAGKLTFRDVDDVSDMDGQMRWVKPNAVPRTTTYPGGFAVTRSIIGSRFAPPAKGSWAMPLTETLYNAWLRLDGPDMSNQPALDLPSVDRAVTWSTANKITYYGPDKATVTFSATTGLATGSYTDAARGVSIRFGGALLQKQGLMIGSYMASGGSGLFLIQSR